MSDEEYDDYPFYGHTPEIILDRPEHLVPWCSYIKAVLQSEGVWVSLAYRAEPVKGKSTMMRLKPDKRLIPELRPPKELEVDDAGLELLVKKHTATGLIKLSLETWIREEYHEVDDPAELMYLLEQRFGPKDASGDNVETSGRGGGRSSKKRNRKPRSKAKGKTKTG